MHRDGRAQTQERRLTKAKGGCLLLISTVPPGPIRSCSSRSPRSCFHLPIPRGYHLVQHCPNDPRITLAPIQPSVPQAGRYWPALLPLGHAAVPPQQLRVRARGRQRWICRTQLDPISAVCSCRRTALSSRCSVSRLPTSSSKGTCAAYRKRPSGSVRSSRLGHRADRGSAGGTSSSGRTRPHQPDAT